MGQAFGTTNSHNDERHYTRKEIGKWHKPSLLLPVSFDSYVMNVMLTV